MPLPDMASRLLDACADVSAPPGVTFDEPYIPFVPDRWNGVLVLAEAQNHGVASREYVDWLQGLTRQARLSRLYRQPPPNIGIGPWDDSTLKVAIASLGLCTDCTAVSNGVLWSSVSERNTNRSPHDVAIPASARLWRQFLDVLQPRAVVACGKNAQLVASEAASELRPSPTVLPLRLPAPTSLSRLRGIFSSEDLERRYPEVATVLREHPAWFSSYRENKILYGCHAVSIAASLSSWRRHTV